VPDLTLLGISGSLRSGSYNARLLRAAGRELPEGVELRLLDGLRAIPPYDEDDDDGAPPAPVALLRAELARADGLIVATPEYNQSIPGQLKNAVDWASRPFPDNALRFLPSTVVGASVGAFGAVWAQAELRKVLAACGARVTEGDLALGHAHERFDAEGNLIDDEAREQLREVLGLLVGEMRARGAVAVS
jgi:chromate reductase